MNFRYILPLEKISFSYRNFRFIQKPNIKKGLFPSSQKVVRNEPNSLWITPCVGGKEDKIYF